ncbi:hypothetical protein EJB05_33975, partial [Eragrostis curvula]
MRDRLRALPLPLPLPPRAPLPATDSTPIVTSTTATHTSELAQDINKGKLKCLCYISGNIMVSLIAF